MGIQSFTKVFAPKRELKYSDLKGKNIVIDARAEIYRCSLGIKLSENLTDANGKPTTHINVILLGVILKLKGCGANQFWVFDYMGDFDGDFHIQLKKSEIDKRRKRREEARQKIESQKKKEAQAERLFSSDDEDEKEPSDSIAKQAFYLEQFYTDDIIFMLNMLGIPWAIAPEGYEAEQICAMSTEENIFGELMDYVLTPDADALPFGANKVIKRDTRKKKLYEYVLNDILAENNISIDDLIKISLILGWESVKKTPRIGPKTVLNKFRNVVLSDEQEQAFQFFKKKLTADLSINNLDVEPFQDKEKYNELLDWLELEKNFNRSRISAQFQKNKLFL
jgi:5'-3' exonuclease